MEELILEEDSEFKTVATFEPELVRVIDYDKDGGGEWQETWMYTIPYDHLSKLIVKVAAKLAEKEAQR
jgi:hypothetical protein